MSIRMITRGRQRETMIRTTISLPIALIEAADREVAKGGSSSRSGFIEEAIARELWRREQEAIDARYYELADDPDLAEIDRQVMKDFEAIDSESSKLLDAEFGVWSESDEA